VCDDALPGAQVREMEEVSDAGERVDRIGVHENFFEAGGHSLLATKVISRVRDSLRLEMGMALYGNDIDDTVTPWEADLGWIVKMKKGDFLGREALERQRAEGVARKLVGFEMVDRGIARHGYPAHAPHGEGVVTSGTHSPTLGRPIGLAMLSTPDGEIGTEFQVDIRGRAARAQVVPTPFYRRAKT
jgi:aminomethyltransferase